MQLKKPKPTNNFKKKTGLESNISKEALRVSDKRIKVLRTKLQKPNSKLNPFLVTYKFWIIFHN